VSTMWTKGIAVLLVCALINLFCLPVSMAQGDGATSPAPTEDTSSGTPKGAGLQAASWLLTIPYGAAKVVFAILGGVTGGLTYAFSGGNLDSAKSVWRTTAYGTYVLTPDHLKGDKPVRFLGVPAEGDSEAPPPAIETTPAR
jgi:hypothetical protein